MSAATRSARRALSISIFAFPQMTTSDEGTATRVLYTTSRQDDAWTITPAGARETLVGHSCAGCIQDGERYLVDGA